jgi:hypothetical protein
MRRDDLLATDLFYRDVVTDFVLQRVCKRRRT